jgi:hypothetical protein
MPFHPGKVDKPKRKTCHENAETCLGTATGVLGDAQEVPALADVEHAQHASFADLHRKSISKAELKHFLSQ